jgi:hypothetical protein
MQTFPGGVIPPIPAQPEDGDKEEMLHIVLIVASLIASNLKCAKHTGICMYIAN